MKNDKSSLFNSLKMVKNPINTPIAIVEETNSRKTWFPGNIININLDLKNTVLISIILQVKK